MASKKAKQNRPFIKLACQNKKEDGTVCKKINYVMTKNRHNGQVSLKKFCSSCRAHTLHNEIK